jgi:hypothetical protein
LRVVASVADSRALAVQRQVVRVRAAKDGIDDGVLSLVENEGSPVDSVRGVLLSLLSVVFGLLDVLLSAPLVCFGTDFW